MKLKTKLIPLTGLGLTALSIAPISLTSCSKNIIGKAFDLVKNYYPTFVKHEYAELKRHDIHDIYTEEILNRPETFVEDYFWSKSWRGTSFDQFFFWDKLLFSPTMANEVLSKICWGASKNNYEYDREIISNLEITTQKAKHYETVEGRWVEWVFPTLSFTLQFDSKINQIILDKYFGTEGISGYLNGTANGKISFHNVPFSIEKKEFKSYSETGGWIRFPVICFQPNTKWMLQRTELYNPAQPEDWKIETEVKSTISGEIKYVSGIDERIADDWTLSVEANPQQPNWEYDSISLEQTVASSFTASYFLNNIRWIGGDE